MKKTLTGTLALLAGAFAIHAQGLISLGNYLILSPYIHVNYLSGGHLVALGGANSGGGGSQYSSAASEANGNLWTVQLWAATGANQPASALTLAGGVNSVTLANGVSDATLSTWYSTGVATVGSGNLGGSQATVELVAWYNGTGITSYAAAQGVVPSGASALANITMGGPQPSGPTLLPAALPAGVASSGYLGDITLTVPEPSTIALGVIGASAFLMRLRRKN